VFWNNSVTLDVDGEMNVAIVEGRPLRGWHGRVQRARARLGHSHLTDQSALQMRPDLRRALADHWQAQGELEHSSVVAYQDLARRLALLDASDDLVQRSLAAADQEARHGERSFELAGRYLGRSMREGRLRRPLRLPRSRTSELCAVAVETLLDGVLLEAYASRMASARADRATDQRARDALLQIAADDALHAALGREVLDWCLQVGGQQVRDAVREAAFDLPTEGPPVVVPPGLDTYTLAAHGLYDADPTHEVFRDLAAAVRDVYVART
jgi:hypothetical protein